MREEAVLKSLIHNLEQSLATAKAGLSRINNEDVPVSIGPGSTPQQPDASNGVIKFKRDPNGEKDVFIDTDTQQFADAFNNTSYEGQLLVRGLLYLSGAGRSPQNRAFVDEVFAIADKHFPASASSNTH